MIGDLYIDLFLILICLLIAAWIMAGETAIVSAAKSKLEELASSGDRRAKAVLELKERLDELVASSQISSTLLIVLASALGGSVTILYLQPYFIQFNNAFIQKMSYWIAIILGVFTTSVGALVISALIPKSLGLKYAETFSLRSSLFFLLLLKVFRIPQKVLTGIANMILKPFKDSTTFSEPQLSEEAIMTIIEKGTESGVIDQTEHDLIESIFQFTETTAKEIMIPRTSIVAIHEALPPEEILKVVMEEGYTRMPVYSGSIDNIIGVVYAKDVLSLIEHRDLIILHDIMRPVFFVPETKSISDLLREFQRKKIHLAVVVDEFGGTEGLITLEDILEEIVGEIHDEYDEDIKPFEVLADGSFVVDGLLNVTDFNDLTVFHIPESEEYDTVAGFVGKVAGTIPVVGEKYRYGSLEISVLTIQERRIEKVKFSHVADENETITLGDHQRYSSASTSSQA